MLVLKQLVIVASGCVVGTVSAGFFLAATSPAATRSLDYLLAAMVFLIGFVAGTAVAGRVTVRFALFQPAPEAAGEPAVGPLVEWSPVMPSVAQELTRSR
jgi:sensor histidine kinase regulating citrate/malate metabolism